MGLRIPSAWREIPDWFQVDRGKSREVHWMRNIYEALGNGVPVYMARAFGRMYPV